MGSVGAVALSGLFASETRISVAANNIANVDSSNYHAEDVVQSSVAGGGVSTQVVDRNPPTITVPDGEGNTTQKPNVDLDQDLVQANVATYTAQADIKVLQTQDKLNKYLIDIQA